MLQALVGLCQINKSITGFFLQKTHIPCGNIIVCYSSWEPASSVLHDYVSPQSANIQQNWNEPIVFLKQCFCYLHKCLPSTGVFSASRRHRTSEKTWTCQPSMKKHGRSQPSSTHFATARSPCITKAMRCSLPSAICFWSLCRGCSDICWFVPSLSASCCSVCLSTDFSADSLWEKRDFFWYLVLNLNHNNSDYFLEHWEFSQPSHSTCL